MKKQQAHQELLTQLRQLLEGAHDKLILAFAVKQGFVNCDYGIKEPPPAAMKIFPMKELGEFYAMLIYGMGAVRNRHRFARGTNLTEAILGLRVVEIREITCWARRSGDLGLEFLKAFTEKAAEYCARTESPVQQVTGILQSMAAGTVAPVRAAA